MSHDLRWNGTDIVRKSDGDIDRTDNDVEILEQKVALTVGGAVTQVGGVASGERLGAIESSIVSAIERDTDLTVTTVDVTQLDRENNTVTGRVQTRHNGTLSF